MSSLAALRAKPHTSISRIQVYLRCPRRYFLQYIERLEPAFRAVALVVGSAFHATVGKWLLSSLEEVQPDELRAHLRDGIVRGVEQDGPPVLFDHAEQNVGAVIDSTLSMLEVFLQHVARPAVVHGVEVPFSLELVHPVTGEVLDVPLIGAMDAVVDEHGFTRVWEVKTGARRWSQDQLDFDLQPTAYQMAVRDLGYSDAAVTLIAVTKKKPAVQVEELVRHPGDEAELVDIAFAVQRAVAAGVDYPMRGWQCRMCPYAGACGS
jgi:CRISPR/Cas system-associated exonuclease Cas4 (RecB family)